MHRKRLAAVVVLVVATAACGTSTTADGPISFGIAGGNVIPFRAVIQPNGRVHLTGPPRTARHRITPAQARRLRREIQNSHLASRSCPGVLPDVAARYVRVGGQTFTVHGVCDAAFERVWSNLTAAVGLR